MTEKKNNGVETRKNIPQKDKKSAEETGRYQKRKNRAKQKKKRQMQIFRTAAVIVVVAVIVIAGGIMLYGRKKEEPEPEPQKTAQTTQNQPDTEMLDVSEVLHLSFDSLIAMPETAFGLENVQTAQMLNQQHLTVDEFNKILQQLYDESYILVDITNLDAPENTMLPKGKKPLIISQRNVNYDLRLWDKGFASKLIVDASGKITNERVRLDGSTLTGDFDVVPCVEQFVRTHPDFSFQGAKGIIGLTGYQGVLGYRTDEIFSGTENNPYIAKFGVYDTADEAEKAKTVIDALKNAGWKFACNGYSQNGYNTSLDIVKEDMTKWQENVGALTGPVDILMYPQGNDIKIRQPYDEEDEVYKYLSEQGFKYFCALDMGGPWNVRTDQEIRCNYMAVDGYRMQCDLYKDAGRFTGILDFHDVFDPLRLEIGMKKPDEESAETQSNE